MLVNPEAIAWLDENPPPLAEVGYHGRPYFLMLLDDETFVSSELHVVPIEKLPGFQRMNWKELY